MACKKIPALSLIPQLAIFRVLPASYHLLLHENQLSLRNCFITTRKLENEYKTIPPKRLMVGLTLTFSPPLDALIIWIKASEKTEMKHKYSLLE